MSDWWNRIKGDFSGITGRTVGYCFRPDRWGRGHATEAAKAMIQFWFQKLGLHRITATCDVQNIALVRILEKAGMRKEGFFRKNVFQKSKWRDTFLYAVLKL
jgi:ribosomal-protein-alanine N-acetyltransferase